VKRVLLTGMSGTGKTGVIGALAALGYKAVDTDDGWCEPLPDGRQQWQERAIGELLATEDAAVLFVAGCEENQVAFHPRFDVIILLSAPAEVMIERLASRTANTYGKSSAELARVLDDLRSIEPRLRKIADHEIRTTIPLPDVVSAVLRLAEAGPAVWTGHSAWSPASRYATGQQDRQGRLRLRG
jgi:dephospho-CoA kinase